MKRASHLFYKIIATPNLQCAFYKAAKGKRGQKEVYLFEQQLKSNINQIQQQLNTNSFSFTTYQYFKIHDPKERIISVAPFTTRVVHHAIMNICHQTFENQQIYHSYATRPGKGTHKAIIQAVKNNKTNKWFLKLDVKKFFDTINHKVLKKLLAQKFKEPKLLLLFNAIINSYSTNQGVPIGNLTSQYFANFYLSCLDRYAKHTLKIKSYVWYMDDIIVWGKTKAQIWFYYNQLSNFLKTNLQQVFKPHIFNKTAYSYNFLGYILSNNLIQPNKRNRTKYNKKLNHIAHQLQHKTINETKALQVFWSMYQYNNVNINNYV